MTRTGNSYWRQRGNLEVVGWKGRRWLMALRVRQKGRGGAVTPYESGLGDHGGEKVNTKPHNLT